MRVCKWAGIVFFLSERRLKQRRERCSRSLSSLVFFSSFPPLLFFPSILFSCSHWFNLSDLFFFRSSIFSFFSFFLDLKEIMNVHLYFLAGHSVVLFSPPGPRKALLPSPFSSRLFSSQLHHELTVGWSTVLLRRHLSWPAMSNCHPARSCCGSCHKCGRPDLVSVFFLPDNAIPNSCFLHHIPFFLLHGFSRTRGGSLRRRRGRRGGQRPANK